MRRFFVMPQRFAALLGLGVALWSVLLGCQEEIPFLPTIVERPARSVRITKVLAYQTHAKVLFDAARGDVDAPDQEPDGAPEAFMVDVPLLEGKRTLIRVFVEPVPGEGIGEVFGRLKVKSATDDEGEVLEDRAWIFSPSTPEAMGSSLNFILESDRVTSGVTVQVELFESRIVIATDDEAGDPLASRWPASGRARLRPQPAPEFRVVLVPLVASAGDADDVRVPEPSEELLQRLRNRVTDLFPVQTVELSVDAPLELTDAVDAFGGGWPAALEALASRREESASEAIYFGLLAPTENRSGFCPLSCVQGMTLKRDTSEAAFERVAMGLAFDDDATAEMFVHEIGHALGRMHAPCNAEDETDPEFPTEGGEVGTWGWSAVDDRLHPPSDKDFMSYCAPQWIHPYQTAHLLEALRAAEP